MSLVAPVENGKITETSSQSSVSKSGSSTTTNKYDKDMFLQLLVAEVKYQDPLEPSSNTEWVSQYATFSELESMQNMSSSYDLSRASALVGETVIMKVTSSTGETNYIQGSVDFVTYESNKAYLSIEGSLYSIDDLYNVVDPTYLAAYDKAYDWSVSLNKLPTLANTSLEDREKIESLYKTYDEMTDYEKTFITEDNRKSIAAYYEKLQALIKQNEETDTEGSSSDDATEETTTV